MNPSAGLNTLSRLALALSTVALAACGGSGNGQSPQANAGGDAPQAEAPGAPARVASNATGPLVKVYKSPTCGCCRNWVDHLRENGFDVVAIDTDDLAAVKTAHGVPRAVESCHTAIVDGYVIEGHVPSDLIAKLLTERPAIAGLAVPGMPMGSPGMEMPDGTVPRYTVERINADGSTTPFATHGE